jgi:1-acyl-sn-glycerol-3-phosphate acyltransferase
VVVLNHPSWWDPLVCTVLSELFPGRAHFAPIEVEALGRYRFFERLGFFGVRAGSVAGAREFLCVGRAVLRRPDTALWVTGQGRFTDPRERPPGLRPGVAHLVQGLDVTILPLALEYPFWSERFPEALARFGEPIRIEGGAQPDARQWLSVIENGLATTQDALAAEARARDPAAFQVVLGGRAGVGGIYDIWRRLRAWLRGERFHPEHGKTEGVEPRGGRL